jgi:hypothetical protein
MNHFRNFFLDHDDHDHDEKRERGLTIYRLPSWRRPVPTGCGTFLSMDITSGGHHVLAVTT